MSIFEIVHALPLYFSSIYIPWMVDSRKKDKDGDSATFLTAALTC
jgi:hypothetical protein